MGGSLSIHSEKINMFGHDGFMGSNAAIGVGACFSSKKPTIIFIGDAALEEDYVLASLSWVAKKKLPILFVVEDNNLSVHTPTDIAWNRKNINVPDDVVYYKYENGYPHHGTGMWVDF